jgi:hypothetical protein
MKYGQTNTWKGKQRKKHGHTVKPAISRYFSNLQWLKNKERKLKKENKI